MLSKPPMQLFERAKARFGLEVEVFDATLTATYPPAETPLKRSIEQSPALRQALSDCLGTGVPGQAVVDGVSYRITRVRRGSGNRRSSAMVAATHCRTADLRLASLWDEVVAAILQTEAEVADSLTAQSDLSRRLLAMLRFLRNLAERDH